MSRSSLAKRRPTKRAVLYIRVSKAREEMISPETQEHACRSLCEREGIEVVEVVSDLDLSGRTFAKRQIDYVIRGIEEDRWDVVVVWKWSRFGRNLLASLVNIDKLQQVGGKVRAATEDFDATTTMGKFSRDQFLLLAALQADQIGDTWKEAHARRRRNGLPHTGERRFGYTYDHREGFKIDPVEGPALAEAYNRVIKGDSYKSVATWLNSKHIKTVPGNNWSPSSLSHLLQNGFGAGYIGEGYIKRGEYVNMLKGAHEGVISERTWREYLAKTERREAYVRNNKKAYSISGLVICGLCGGKMRARNTNGGKARTETPLVGHTFECGRKADRGACPGAYGARSIIEEMALDAIRQRAIGSSSAKQNLAHVNRASKIVSEVDDLEQQLVALKKSRSFLVTLLEDGDIERDDYRVRKADVDAKISDVTSKIGSATTQATRVSGAKLTTDAAAAIVKILGNWDEFTEAGRRSVLEVYIKAIVVYPGKAYTNEQRAEKYKVIHIWEDLPDFPHAPTTLPTRAPVTTPAP